MNIIKIKKQLFLVTTFFFLIYFFLVSLDFVISRFFYLDLDTPKKNILKNRFANNKHNFLQFYINSTKEISNLKIPVYPFYFLIDDYYNQLALEFNDILPLGLLPYSTYIKCGDEGYGYQISTTDRYGFFNNDIFWDSKDIDLLIIGDSFAASFCVNFENSIDFNLKEIGLKILNLSLPGNSPIIYSSLFKNFSELKNFSNIAIIFFGNDNVYEKNNIYDKKYFSNYKKNYLNLKRENSINSEVYEFIKITEKKVLKKSLNNNKNYFFKSLKYFKLKKIRYFTNFFFDLYLNKVTYSNKLIVDLVEEHCKILNCNPIYIYIPHNDRARKILLNDMYVKNLTEYIRKHGNDLINLTDGIYSDKLNNYSIEGTHLSPAGYKIVSDALKKNIKSVK
jgi:hypothetical protein